MKKNDIIHFSIFTPLTLLFICLSVFGFSKTNIYIEKYETSIAEVSSLSDEKVVPNNKLNKNNKVIDNEDLHYYCSECNEFFDDSVETYEYDSEHIYHNACPNCSDFSLEEIVAVVDSSEKKQELREENENLILQLQQIDEKMIPFMNEQEFASQKLIEYSSISILSAPLALTLLFVTLFARKKD